MQSIRFYLDHELVILWQELDRNMDDEDWSQYVFMFRFMLCTGTRAWETTQIRVEDCHPDYVHIRFGKGEGVVQGTYKERMADIHPTILQPYYEAYLRSLPPDQEWLFPAHHKRWKGGRYDRKRYFKQKNFKTLSVRTLRWRWNSFVEKIGIRYLPLHEAFRKSFATWFYEEMSRADLQDQLGHKDYRTTDKIYRGSIPGRRFRKPTVQWKLLAEEGARKIAQRLERKLHVVGMD